MATSPRLSPGAHVGPDGTVFRVWAPGAQQVDIALEPQQTIIPMQMLENGLFETRLRDAAAGTLYRFRLDGGAPLPDPASRFQPLGVHGPSQVVDPHAYTWHDRGWQGVPPRQWVIYELHVGTFTPAGTFAAVTQRLDYLADLGITVLELMPVHDFPGRWNWGYDPAALYAPSRAYGTPDDLRALVDAAHQRGIAVFLDVVYNHLGPTGAYVPAFNPDYFSSQHRSPWGAGINLDGPQSKPVRHFLLENARYWFEDFHIDGLRVDAAHALIDDSPKHFLAELSEVATAATPPRQIIAEDPRNWPTLVQPRDQGGYGLDGLWVDDFHNQLHVLLTGEQDGYYQDFAPKLADLAQLLNQGWLYTGQHSPLQQAPRGYPAAGVRPEQMVYCLQNHDQVGNRAHGDRLNTQLTPAQYRAATCLLLAVSPTPLLWMGQEWAATTPFLYFTDHDAELGAQVSAGRKAEFAKFAAFAGAIPDPQDPMTFARSHLRWEELQWPAHANMRQLVKDMLVWRRAMRGPQHVEVLGEAGLWIARGHHAWVIFLRPYGGEVQLPRAGRLRWHSERSSYTEQGRQPRLQGRTFACDHAVAALMEHS